MTIDEKLAELKAQMMPSAEEVNPIREPPLGLKPRWLHDEQRLAEVDAAIERYTKERRIVPQEWLDEQEHLQFQKRIHNKQMGLIVKGRKVLNDAVVGEWYDLPEIQPPTFQGIVSWMSKLGGYDISLLEKGVAIGDPDHIVGYGLRYQFWVPTPDDLRREAQDAQQQAPGTPSASRRVVICKDDCGDCGLTKGKEYQVLTYQDDGMIRVQDDTGKERDYFPERFHAIPGLAGSTETEEKTAENVAAGV